MGLIRRYALPGVPMYSDPLSIAEVAQRIRRYYEPYHEILESLIDSASARFGSIWHINCHSMKSAGKAMNSDNGRARPDMVVSDRNGASANADFTDWVATELRQLGYQVQINNPYQGGHIIHRYGNPSSGRQSIQIEIKRSLYMNEATFEKTEGFAPLQESLEVFMRNLKRRVEEQLSERQSACSVNP
jgi:N-formylglutamate deformylase